MSEKTEDLRNVLLKTKKFLQQAKNKVTMYVWDIDDTLFTSDAKILIFKDKEQVAELSTEQYANDYQHLPQNQNFMFNGKDCGKRSQLKENFIQFTDPVFFYKHAKPTNLLRTAQLQFTERHNMFIVLSARDNMIISFERARKTLPSVIITKDRSNVVQKDENSAKNIFLEKFRKHGLSLTTDRSHFIRMASLRVLPDKPHYDKGKVLKELLDGLGPLHQTINHISFWDDSEHERNAVKNIAKDFPNIQFTLNPSESRGARKGVTITINPNANVQKQP